MKNDNEAIIDFYEIKETFKISKYSHKLPFNKFNLRKLEKDKLFNKFFLYGRLVQLENILKQ